MYLLQLIYFTQSFDKSLTDLGPLTPGVCSTLISLAAPGLKLSSLWATEATEARIRIVSPVIMCGDLVSVLYSRRICFCHYIFKLVVVVSRCFFSQKSSLTEKCKPPPGCININPPVKSDSLEMIVKCLTKTAGPGLFLRLPLAPIPVTSLCPHHMKHNE